MKTIQNLAALLKFFYLTSASTFPSKMTFDTLDLNTPHFQNSYLKEKSSNKKVLILLITTLFFLFLNAIMLDFWPNNRD